jgi:hypothetical protein
VGFSAETETFRASAYPSKNYGLVFKVARPKADSAPFTYSPDLNPIEEAFAKLEALLRRAAARSHEALVESMGAALDAINTQDAHAAPLGPAEEVRQ